MTPSAASPCSVPPPQSRRITLGKNSTARVRTEYLKPEVRRASIVLAGAPQTSHRRPKKAMFCSRSHSLAALRPFDETTSARARRVSLHRPLRCTGVCKMQFTGHRGSILPITITFVALVLSHHGQLGRPGPAGRCGLCTVCGCAWSLPTLLYAYFFLTILDRDPAEIEILIYLTIYLSRTTYLQLTISRFF